jgi:hypothetical protein
MTSSESPDILMQPRAILLLAPATFLPLLQLISCYAVKLCMGFRKSAGLSPVANVPKSQKQTATLLCEFSAFVSAWMMQI